MNWPPQQEPRNYDVPLPPNQAWRKELFGEPTDYMGRRRKVSARAAELKERIRQAFAQQQPRTIVDNLDFSGLDQASASDLSTEIGKLMPVMPGNVNQRWLPSDVTQQGEAISRDMLALQAEPEGQKLRENLVQRDILSTQGNLGQLPKPDTLLPKDRPALVGQQEDLKSRINQLKGLVPQQPPPPAVGVPPGGAPTPGTPIPVPEPPPPFDLAAAMRAQGPPPTPAPLPTRAGPSGGQMAGLVFSGLADAVRGYAGLPPHYQDRGLALMQRSQDQDYQQKLAQAAQNWEGQKTGYGYKSDIVKAQAGQEAQAYGRSAAHRAEGRAERGLGITERAQAERTALFKDAKAEKEKQLADFKKSVKYQFAGLSSSKAKEKLAELMAVAQNMALERPEYAAALQEAATEAYTAVAGVIPGVGPGNY